MAQIKPPKKVLIAIVLFCAAIIPGIIRVGMIMKDLDSPSHLLLAWLLIVATILFYGFIIYKIYQGKDYARSILVILILTAITLNIIGITPPMDNSQLSMALISVEIVLSLIGFYLIYHKDVSGWFKTTL